MGVIAWQVETAHPAKHAKCFSIWYNPRKLKSMAEIERHPLQVPSKTSKLKPQLLLISPLLEKTPGVSEKVVEAYTNLDSR
jgi:hypothetical protein